MNIKKIIERILGRRTAAEYDQTTVNHSGYANGFLMKLIHEVEHTQEHELSCDEVYELLDLYAESSVKGEDIAHLYPLVKNHLAGCSDCREEYEALLRILEASTDSG